MGLIINWCNSTHRIIFFFNGLFWDLFYVFSLILTKIPQSRWRNKGSGEKKRLWQDHTFLWLQSPLPTPGEWSAMQKWWPLSHRTALSARQLWQRSGTRGSRPWWICPRGSEGCGRSGEEKVNVQLLFPLPKLSLLFPPPLVSDWF